MSSIHEEVHVVKLRFSALLAAVALVAVIASFAFAASAFGRPTPPIALAGFNPLQLLLSPQLLGILALAVGSWLGTRIIQPRDHERAAILSQIATGSAALARAMYPSAPWSTLLEATIKQISAAAGVPTESADAIRRAAAAALSDAGVKPS